MLFILIFIYFFNNLWYRTKFC